MQQCTILYYAMVVLDEAMFMLQYTKPRIRLYYIVV